MHSLVEFWTIQAQAVGKLSFFDAKSIYLVRILAESRTSGEGKRPLRSAGRRSWQIRQPAPQSKLRELHPKDSLRLLCAGDTENAKQPGFYVDP